VDLAIPRGRSVALVLDPEFLVCDEVTRALDVSVQAEILQLLLDLQREHGLTLLVITHNLGVVEYVSHETLVVRAGRILEHGPTARVCRNPEHPYPQQLRAAVPRVGCRGALRMNRSCAAEAASEAGPQHGLSRLTRSPVSRALIFPRRRAIAPRAGFQ
jgi:ABC-type dipeptide/oligopeptide/nickel transport system ATPase component